MACSFVMIGVIVYGLIALHRENRSKEPSL